jgi:hypothetical protein
MKIFIINLNSAPERYVETFTALLNGTGVDAKDVHRFDAERADYEAERLTSVCRALCPSKTLGCALSHRAVADEALRGDNNKSFPILVLEDDSFPARPQSLLNDLESEAARSSQDWDIILLNTINVIYKPPIGASSSALSGSTAAYLLSESGALKLRNCAIPWHADLMRNSYNFSVIQGPELFKTRDLTPTGITFGGRDIMWFARQPYIRIPRSTRNYNLSCGNVFVAILLLIVAFLWSVSNTRGSIAKLLGANLTGMLLAATTAWVWYVTQDSNYARLSPSTARIAAVGAALSVILASRTLWAGCGEGNNNGDACVAQLPALVLFGGYASITTLLLWRDEERCRHHHHHHHHHPSTLSLPNPDAPSASDSS